jgi:hypothetical protein
VLKSVLAVATAAVALSTTAVGVAEAVEPAAAAQQGYSVVPVAAD